MQKIEMRLTQALLFNIFFCFKSLSCDHETSYCEVEQGSLFMRLRGSSYTHQTEEDEVNQPLDSVEVIDAGGIGPEFLQDQAEFQDRFEACVQWQCTAHLTSAQQQHSMTRGEAL